MVLGEGHDAADLPADTLLGLRIAREWTHCLTEQKIAYGPMAALWVSQKLELKEYQRANVHGGDAHTEVHPVATGLETNVYEHGPAYLRFLKAALMEAGAWVGIKREGMRYAPVNAEQLAASSDPQIEHDNKNLLQGAFERISCLPGTPGSFVRMRTGVQLLFS